MSDLVERARSIADDAMGMEPEDRHTVSELINEIEAKDKRIAELKATCKDREAEIKSLSGHLEASISRNERLWAVIDTIKHYCYSGGTHVITVQRIIEQDLAAAQEGEGE